MRNDYVQTVILAVILFVGVFAFWFGLRFAFQSEFPLLAVASGSMEPFLYRGDLIIVQGGLNFTGLNAALKDAQPPGEVIVFYHPQSGRPPPVYLPVAGTEAHLIVHRAVYKELNNETWYFRTRGDANFGNDPWKVSQDYVVGKVIGKVPWIGNIPLFMHENPFFATFIIVLLFAVLIVVDFILPLRKKGEDD